MLQHVLDVDEVRTSVGLKLQFLSLFIEYVKWPGEMLKV